jgi:A/G-specific adenine glycosylase
MLKKKENLAVKSAHYRKQSPFAGSNRELRSKILKLLLAHQSLSEKEIIQTLNQTPESIQKNLIRLQGEGFITIAKGKITIA